MSPLLLTALKILPTAKIQEKQTEAIKFGKEEIRLSLFANKFYKKYKLLEIIKQSVDIRWICKSKLHFCIIETIKKQF